VQDVAPAPADGLHTWMGLRWSGQALAVRASQLAMVFRSRAPASGPAQAGAALPVDVEVHAGVPVFVQPVPHVLVPLSQEAGALSSAAPPLQPGAGWVVALKVPQGSALGCRVDSLVGPFQARAEGGVLVHDQREWRIMIPRTDWHA